MLLAVGRARSNFTGRWSLRFAFGRLRSTPPVGSASAATGSPLARDCWACLWLRGQFPSRSTGSGSRQQNADSGPETKEAWQRGRKLLRGRWNGSVEGQVRTYQSGRRAAQGSHPTQRSLTTGTKWRHWQRSHPGGRLPIQPHQDAFPPATSCGTQPAIVAQALKAFG